MITENRITEWLNASYEYYWGFEDPGMSDFEWDYLSREIHKDLDLYEKYIPPVVYSKMKEYEWDGGSLFFVPKDAYK